MTHLTPEFIQAKSIVKFYPVLGGGGQAPDYVTLRKWGEQWVTHFYNVQDQGFYCGHYRDTLKDAEKNFKHRIEEYEQRLATFAHD